MTTQWIHADRAITGDGQTVLSPAWIGIEGETIRKVSNQKPAEATPENTTSLGDVTLTPGLMNLHDHISRKVLTNLKPGMSFSDQSRKLMAEDPNYLLLHSVHNVRDALLRQGITWIRDYGLAGYTSVHLRRAINEGLVDGPDISTCGRPICQTGGHTYAQSHEADGPDAVRGAVRYEVRQGADVIKFMASGGLEHFPKEDPYRCEYSVEELRAGVEAARDCGLMTAAHVYPTQAILRAIRAGIDSLEHAVLLTEECLDEMVKHGTVIVPTLTGLRNAKKTGPDTPEFKRLQDELRRRIYDPQEEGMRKAQAAGILIGAGTDSAGLLADEIRLIADVLDETPVQAIAHATGIGAKIVRMPHLGLLAEGKRADIVAFRGDLTASLDALDHVVQVWKRGKSYL